MRVAVLCEHSGAVRDAFIARGHEAVSCDILPTSVPGPHIQGDCLAQDWSGYDLIVAHPPCTYLCNSGVRWLSTQPGRMDKMRDAAKLFRAILALPCERIAVENPIPHRHAELPDYTQIVQPWQHGHGETKATCFWLKGLPALTPTNIVPGRDARIHKMPPSADRGHLRSLTYLGIAAAMAEQWTHPPATQKGKEDDNG